MGKDKILIVDDEPEIRQFVAQAISSKYQVLFAEDHLSTFQIAKSEQPDVILLDMMINGVCEIDTCRKLREDHLTKYIPIIMLTAINDPERRTQAYELGADDYLTKPFTPKELLARIESKLQRAKDYKANSKNSISYGDLTLNFEESTAYATDTLLDVGPVEFRILNCLIKNQGKLVDRDILHNFIWGKNIPSERALDPHINSLRKKLKPSTCELKTVYGKGFNLIITTGNN